MMNKKGALFHWIVLGLLLAAGIFFLNVSDEITTISAKGQWQTSFIKDYVLEAESQLINQDAQIREISETILVDVLKQPCGNLYATLNQKPYCVTINSIRSQFLSKVEVALQEKYPHQFTDIKLENNLLSAKGISNTITYPQNKFNKYTYNTGFTINIGYDFTEFAELLASTQALVQSCKGHPDLDTCIISTQNFPGTACEATYFPGGTERAFCIQSPQLLQNQPAKYTFTLDFS